MRGAATDLCSLQYRHKLSDHLVERPTVRRERKTLSNRMRIVPSVGAAFLEDEGALWDARAPRLQSVTSRTKHIRAVRCHRAVVPLMLDRSQFLAPAQRAAESRSAQARATFCSPAALKWQSSYRSRSPSKASELAPLLRLAPGSGSAS